MGHERALKKKRLREEASNNNQDFSNVKGTRADRLEARKKL
jgi:hypothetical protein